MEPHGTQVHESFASIEKAVGWIERDIREREDVLLHEAFLVGIHRGGLIPAVMLSHLLDLPMVALHPGLAGIYPLVEPKRTHAIIIDDVLESGRTMTTVVETLASKFTVDAYALFNKSGHQTPWPRCAFNRSKDHWLVFPWEKPSSQVVNPFEALEKVLHLAYERASLPHEKGMQRHGSPDLPFDQQAICTEARHMNTIAPNIFQARKKLLEALRLPRDQANKELLDAIVYIAGAHIVNAEWMEEEEKKDGDL